MAQFCDVCGSRMLTFGGTAVCINFKRHKDTGGRGKYPGPRNTGKKLPGQSRHKKKGKGS